VLKLGGLGFVTLIVLLAACTPPLNQPRDNGTQGAEAQAPRRTLVMAIAPEPEALSLEIGSAFALVNPVRLFNASLVLLDDREVPRPYLAEAVPELNSETWKVFPDGRMETIYRLRSGLTWHDGSPLSADDFVLAWDVYRTPDFGVAGRPPQSEIEQILAPDARTVLITWRGPYAGAGALGSEKSALLALPRHILGHYRDEGRLAAAANDAYWTREYVGAGPYRLDRWETGSFLEAAAFDGHALGRPKIDRVKMLFINDPNTVLANALAGEVQVADRSAIRFDTGSTLRQAGMTLLASPSAVTMTQTQLRPEVARPIALLELGVRKALAHAVDRQALNDALFDGEGVLADAMVPTTLGYYPAIDAAIAKYAYDPRRSEQLMLEAGFTRGGDGVFAHPVHGRFTFESWQVSRVPNDRELSIMTDGWRRAGFDPQPNVLPPAQILNHEFKTTIPGVMTTGSGADEGSLRQLSTAGIPTAENRWSGGTNFGGWSDAEYDGLLDTFNRTLERGERARLVAQMMRRVTDQLPWIFLYYSLAPTAHIAALQGPQAATPDRPSTWNVHEWEWR